MVEDSWAGVSRHARGGSEMEIDNENEMPQLRSMGKGVRGVGEGMEGGLAEGLKNSLRGAGGGNKNAGGKGATDLIVSASLVNVKDKRLRSLLVFAHTLENDLDSLDTSTSSAAFNFAFTTIEGNGTFKDLENNIATFPIKLSASAKDKSRELDEKATEIWNLGTRLKRSLSDDDEIVDDEGERRGATTKSSDKKNELKSVLVMVRMFAFQLLNCANECGNGNSNAQSQFGLEDKNKERREKARGNLLRLMKVGVKTVRDCLKGLRTNYAVKVLEKLAAYSDALLRAYDSSSTPEEKATCARLTAEYFVLRTLLAWRQDDMQLAEHMFDKSMASKHLFDHSTTESLADTLYEMGKSLLKKEDYKLSIKWLERAYDIINSNESDKMSADATELRVSIIETLIKAFLETKTEDSIQQARNLVNLLEDELGNKLIVLLLKLDLLTEPWEETFDGPAYSAILNKMTRILVLNSNNLRMFMFHVRKLHDKAPSLACGVLDDLIRLRIGDLKGYMEWLEKVILTRIWMMVGGRECEELFVAVEGFLDVVRENLEGDIGVEASMAAHTLIWKRIEANYGLKQYAMAEKWCRLAMHKLFEAPGEANMAKIARKLLLCVLNQGDINSARDVFGSMSATAKEEPLSRFLMYKIAIRSQEIELAAECLEKVASSSEDPTLLYACVLDAQKVGDKTHVLSALWMVLDKCGYGAQENLRLPAIIRTVIVLLVGLIEDEKSSIYNNEEEVEKLCKLFEGALTAIHKSPNRTTWTILELEWFSRNAYNLSLKYLSIWTTTHSLRMLTACIAFINHYPQDIGQEAHDDITLRKMFCNFCAATTYVSIARAEQDVEVQLQYYLDLRKHVRSFDQLLQGKLEKLEEPITRDLLKKLEVLLAFDFEAACRLRDWEGLGGIVERAGGCGEVGVFEVLADCILSCEVPTQVLILTLKKITNKTWEMQDLDTAKLSIYMRCLFQAALGFDDRIAVELLDRVCGIAQEAKDTPHPYPAQEIDYLATKAFNYAIDLYSKDQDEKCRDWAGKAILLAGFTGDEGNLERLLRERWAGLRWD